MKTTKDQASAVIYGLACGDALGWPTEFMKRSSIEGRFGERGITDLRQTKGEYTDDTQMTIALAEGLLDAMDVLLKTGDAVKMADPMVVMPYVARRFVAWSISPENDRAPGTSCMGGCRNLQYGRHWTKSGVSEAQGCGSVMRVAPVGLVYSDAETIRRIGEATATSTHDSEVARRSAHLGALAVRLALDGLSAAEILARLIETLTPIATPETAKLMDLLAAIPDLVKATMVGAMSTWVVMDYGVLGQSWKADEALASALYCVLLAETRGEGYRETVCYGANTDGDSDSIACIAGGIAGAMWGIGGRGVPTAWVEMIENRAKLGLLAESLASLSEATG